MSAKKINIFWFRRDLRLHDNHGLSKALQAGLPVLPIFIFDKNILTKLEVKTDARVTFLHDQLTALNTALKKLKSGIEVFHGTPVSVYNNLLRNHSINQVFTNADYEPYALARDEKIKGKLKQKAIEFKTFKDHVIFEKDEVLKPDGTPYTVFTPYSKRWKLRLQESLKGKDFGSFKAHPISKYKTGFLKFTPSQMPSLSDLKFERSEIHIPPSKVQQKLIKEYDKTRNFPAINGTSKLGIHFRFGTISIREKAKKALTLNGTYFNELIWRDFYSMILSSFPHVATEPFRLKYNRVKWRKSKKDFDLWTQGKTGYPIVDAGMRELMATGHMHNRVRMITASFLTKHLLLDWRWGEAWFARHLLDFDLASNNGGWQWAAGCGTDAAPYFRIFNPTTQQQKFDKDFNYIKKWVPEFGSKDYPQPMVDHKFARERCLRVYKDALS